MRSTRPGAGRRVEQERESTAIDRDFVEYCRSQDPAVLARVFDASAGKLLQLALHLGSTEAAAEDLVQLTFLRILEHSSTFDTERRFLPWATMILQNEARAAFRRSRRREQLPERPPAAEPPALDRARAGEALELLDQALGRLPVKYREVLQLKLLEGLGNEEIAAALGMPEPTVRTRVHRGLGRLRRLLPVGMASLALILLHGRGLARVRTQVLRAAASRGSGGPWGVLRRGRGHAAAAILVAIAAIVGLTTGSEVEHAADGSGSFPVHEQRTAMGATSGVEASPLATRSPQTRGDQMRGAWTLQGFVRDEERRPIPAAEVRATLIWGCAARTLETTACDVSGRYALDISPILERGRTALVGASILVEAQSSGHQPSDPVFVDGVEETALEVEDHASSRSFSADVVLRRGPTLTATVRAPKGGLLEERVTAHIPRVPHEERAPTWRFQELGQDGRLRLALPDRGPCTLFLYGARGSLEVQVPDTRGGDLDLGVLLLRQEHVIRARLLVGGVTPWPFAYYELRDEDGLTVDRGRATADGSIFHHGAKPGRYRLVVDDRAGSEQSFDVWTDAPPRALSIEGQLLEVRVRDASGRPVPGVPLTTSPLSGSGPEERHDIRFEPGCHRLLLPSGSAWKIQARHWLLASAEHEHRCHPNLAYVRLELPVALRTDLGRVELTVHGPDGGPMTGTRLHLTPTLDPLAAVYVSPNRLRHGIPAGSYELSVGAPGHQEVCIPLDVREDDTMCRTVQLQAGATLQLLLTGVGPTSRQAMLGRIVEGQWWPLGLLQNVHGDERVSAGEVLNYAETLRPGHHRLQVRSGRLRSAPFDCRLQEGTSRLIELEMRER